MDWSLLMPTWSLAADIQCVSHVVDVVIDVGLVRTGREVGEVVDAENTTLLDQGAQLLVRLVARMRMHRGAAAMGHDDGDLRMRHFTSRRWVGVAQVDGYSKLVHFSTAERPRSVNPCAPGRGQHAGAERRHVVVRKLHHSNAQVSEDVEMRSTLPSNIATPSKEKMILSLFSRLARAKSSPGPAHLHEEIRVHLGELLREGDFVDGVFEAVVEPLPWWSS